MKHVASLQALDAGHVLAGVGSIHFDKWRFERRSTRALLALAHFGMFSRHAACSRNGWLTR